MTVPLHVHSWYSLLEGTASPEALLRRAAEGGHRALVLTDTNNLYGAVAFAEAAARLGVRPIVGACLRHGGERAVALVADRTGYRNLCRAISRVQMASGGCEPPEGVTSAEAPSPQGANAPRSPDLAEALRDLHEGLHVLVDEPALAEKLCDTFRGRLWLEVIRPRDERHEEKLLECGRRLGLKAVASTAAHLADASEHPTYRVVTAMRRNTLLDRVPAALPVTPEHRLVSVAEMRSRFRDLPEALRHGEELASLLRSDVLPRDLILPRPKLTREMDLVAYLRSLCEKGLRERGRGADLAARERLRKELAIIEANGLPGYFLTVRDIAKAARRRGHTMALRGSAGNSLVCYLLGITDVDPLRFGLEMERFLHPGRADLPDIDLDFDWKERDRVIEHVVERYGQAHVARISTHLFLQPRSAFREAGKLHGLSSEQVTELMTRLDERVDELVGDGHWLFVGGKRERDESALTTFVPTASVRVPTAFPLEAERWPRLLADARRLLGRPMHLSLHPGGIVITPQPVDHYVPVQWAAKGVIMTQFEKDAVEHVGLVKIDLLGNRALSTVDEAKQLCGAPVPIATDSDSDAATLDLLRRGDTVGVVQLESPAMRHLIIQMQPVGLEDIIQSLALLRPGAASIGVKDRFIRRRRGLEAIGDGPLSHNPALAEALGETHGLMLYEDDGLRVIQALTGLPAADADRFRKRISKHQTEEEAEELRQKFFALCERQGTPTEGLGELWLQLAKFNRYSFCKSHAVSYGLIAWQAAYLKAHHPLAFWTAALNNNQGSYPRRVYAEAIKRAGISLRLPCVNRSRLEFVPDEGAIRVGLEAVAGLPEALRVAVVRERDRDGPYRDLADLRRRVSPGPEALATLIRAGAMDFTGRSRPALVLEARLQDRGVIPSCSPRPCTQGRGVGGEGVFSLGETHPSPPAPLPSSTRGEGSKAKPLTPSPSPLGGEGRKSGELFALDPTEGWSPPEEPPERRWRDQWETLGFTLDGPIFSRFRRPVPPVRGVPLIGSGELAAHAGRLVRVQGLVATSRSVFTEDGRFVQFVTLEDDDGFSEVTLFEGTCAQVPYLTMGPYVAMGVVEERFGSLTLTARRFERLGD